MLCAHKELCVISKKDGLCKCGRPITYERWCKVCYYKYKHKDFKIPDGWTEEEIETILYHVLYETYEYLNDIVQLLNNRTLDDLVDLLLSDLKIGKKPQRVKLTCDHCGKEFWLHMSKYVRNRDELKNKFCSRKCSGQYWHENQIYSGAKSHMYKSKPTKCAYCGKEIWKRPAV